MAKKQATQVTQQQPGAAITVGLDIGYGAVKAMIADKEPLIFPSVMGQAIPLGFQEKEMTEAYPGDQLTDDDGDWLIGDLAQKLLTRPGALRRLQGRTSDEATIGNVFRARMAKAALGKLLPGKRNGEAVHIKIATGLPVLHMSDAAGLKEALIGQHHIETDNADFVANITDVMVMPQPYGCIYSQTLTASGDVNDCHSYTRTGVVDVGTYTVDLALDDDGEYIDSESDGVEAGVYTAQEAMRRILENKYREAMPLPVVEEVLRSGCFRAKGEVVDFKAEVQKALEPLRAATIDKMNALWKSATRIDVIYLCGGGAELVEKQIKAAGYSQAVLVLKAQLANAQGYLNYALFKSSRNK